MGTERGERERESGSVYVWVCKREKQVREKEISEREREREILRDRQIDRQTNSETDGQTDRHDDRPTCVLIFLPVLLDSPVQSLDEVVDVFAAPNRISNELQSIGN